MADYAFGSMRRTCCHVVAPRIASLPQVICLSGDSPVQSCLQKFFAFPIGRNISMSRRCPTPLEGRIAIVTDAGRDAVDAAASGAQRDGRAGWRKARERSNGALTRDVAAYGEVVWS